MGLFEDIRAKSKLFAQKGERGNKRRAEMMMEAAGKGEALESINLCHLEFDLDPRDPGTFRASQPVRRSRQSEEAKLCGDLLSLQAGGYWEDAKGGWLDPGLVQEGRKEGGNGVR